MLPTVMELLGVNKSANPTWIVDGVSMLPVMRAADHGAPRSRPLVFSWGNQQGIIDNEWKLITKPAVGQCDQQPGFDFKGAGKDELFLYNLADDIHESRDLKLVEAHQYARMRGLLMDFRASLNYSRHEETGCPQLQARCNVYRVQISGTNA